MRFPSLPALLRVFAFAVSASCVTFSHFAIAQTAKYSCPYFFTDIHQSLDCVEAVFSETPAHLTFSGVPPGNGMALGGVLEDQIHYVSPFASKPDPELRAASFQLTPEFESGYKSLVHRYVTIAGSTNGSWFASGGIDWLPPLHYADARKFIGPVRPNGSRATESCHRLGPLCTQSVFGLSFSGTHRSVQTVSFYGIGPDSPSIKYTYHLNETYGGVSARMPVFDWLTLAGQIEDRQPDLPALTTATAVNNNFTEATAPGIASQPNFMHYRAAVKTLAGAFSEPATADADPNKDTPPLMKHRFVYTFQNDAEYQWYSDLSAGHYSFQEFVFSGDEAMQFGSIIEEYIPASKRDAFPFVKRAFYGFIAHSCGVVDEKVPPGIDPVTGKKLPGHTIKVPNDLRLTSPCDFGKLELKTHLALSHTANGNVIPFYMQPTVGGSDIDSRLSLRGFADYRFRAQNATFLQVDYGIPVYGPFGGLLFYDAGTVAQTLSGLSFAHLRQDAGAGGTLRFGGTVVAQAYLAVGAGHGVHLGYNLVKFF